MKMTRRLAITIAVVCGLLAALLTYVYLSGLQRAQRPPVTPQVSVVTPIETIEAGTVIKSEMVHVQEMPEDRKPPGTVQQVEQIVDDVAAEDLPAGEPIRWTQMASMRRTVDLSIQVPPGMRAVTVALDSIVGVAGFLQPEDRVDVIATFDVGDGMTVTRTVLQNVTLLATGETTIVSKERAAGKEGEEESKVETYPNATLAVTPQQAQRLIISDAKGTLRLALRRKGDVEYRSLKPTDIVSVVGVEYIKKEVEEEPAPPAGEQPPMPSAGLVSTGVAIPAGIGQPPRPTVEVIRGTEREIVAP